MSWVQLLMFCMNSMRTFFHVWLLYQSVLGDQQVIVIVLYLNAMLAMGDNILIIVLYCENTQAQQVLWTKEKCLILITGN